MANNTGWVAGRGVGFTFTSMFAGADLSGLANGSSVLSSLSGITNQSSLDQLADISLENTIASATITAGAYIAFWIAALGNDGSTYGDGNLVAGTAKAYTPGWYPAAIMSWITLSAGLTKLVGYAPQIVLPANSFKWIIQNNSGVTWSTTTANN